MTDGTKTISTKGYITTAVVATTLFLACGVCLFLSSKPHIALTLVMSVVASAGTAGIIAQVYIVKERGLRKAKIVYSPEDLIASFVAVGAIASFIIPAIIQVK
jgi:hypothetical protein